MEILFRFNIMREANRSHDEINPIDLTANTKFQREAAAIPDGSTRPSQLKALAKAYIASNQFVDSPSTNAKLLALEAASIAIDELLENGNTSRSDVKTALEIALGGNTDAFINGAVRRQITLMGDSMLAIKLSTADHNRPIRRIATILRAYHLLNQFNADSNFPADAYQLAAGQRRPFRLSSAILPTRPLPPSRKPSSPVAEKLKELARTHDRLNKAIGELRSIRPGGYAITPQKKSEAQLPPENFRPLALFAEELQIRRETLQATLKAAVSELTGASNTPNVRVGSLADVTAATPFLRSDKLGTETAGLSLAKGARLALLGRTDFTPVVSGHVGMRLSKESQADLSTETRGVLKEHGLSITEPVARTINKLISMRRSVFEQAQTLVNSITQKTYRQLGGTTVAITSSPMPLIYSMSPAQLIDVIGGFLFDPKAGVPTSHADIKPSGVLDLLLVKQQLKGYEAADVSHIANMLKGEKTDRIFRKRLETETLTFTETELTVATEQSLETTDRFEMRRESETALQEETAVKGSLTVKGKYGPTVEFQASGEASWQRKSQESEKAANEVARKVTQKASEKVTDRVLRRESMRINRQVEDIDQHIFDNTSGTGHISGVYQWVTKLYEAQVFNYGPRAVYDIMIPEPGAFLLESFRQRHSAAIELEKPAEFTIKPDQLTEDNYQTYVTLYQATDVKPPPEPFVTESYDFNTGGEDKDQEFTNSTRIAVPDGYQAVRATVGAVVAVWDNWSVDVIVGQRSHRFQSGSSWVWSTSLDEETGAVPMAMVTDRVGDVAIAVEVICESTERADDLWRADTHAKLINAYRARLSEYEAKLAELEAEAPAEIVSGPEARNEAMMTDEVKKAAISILTQQHYDMFDAIDNDSAGLPRIVFTEAATEGAYVRFFEQAFEWENMSWVTYPYFWGRKAGWLDKVVIENNDSDFEAFLKAGYIRVQIPIRPGFVDAVDHFRLFGEPWLGGSLPSISDDTYLPIAEEIAEKLGRPGDEVPVGEPWEVRVPTTLVKLRADDKLPQWEKQPDGTWIEAVE